MKSITNKMYIYFSNFGYTYTDIVYLGKVEIKVICDRN